MHTVKAKDKFKVSLDKERRVFYDFEKYLRFVNSNSRIVEAIKVRPPRLGANGFGSIEVKVKKI